MNSVAIGLVSAACIFGGALIGLVLRTLLPAHHLKDDAKDTIKLSAAIVSTMSALVLGLLIGSAKTSFDAINSGFTQAASKIIQLDHVLAEYGPDANDARAQLRADLAASIQMLWPSENTGASVIAAAVHANRAELFQEKLQTFTPQTDAQRLLLAQAKDLSADISQIKWQMIETAQREIPAPLLVILIFWLSMLFISFGLFAPRNPTIITVLLICALSVSGAIFLIIELNRPMNGIITTSSLSMRRALQQLNQ